MASLAGCQIRVYDVGINTRETLCNVIDEKVAHGTRDFYKEPAMDETQMRQALQCGLDAVYACKCDNLDYVCIGGNGHRQYDDFQCGRQPPFYRKRQRR